MRSRRSSNRRRGRTMKLRWLTLFGICVALAACGHNAAPSVNSNTLSTGVRPAASPTASPTPTPTPAYNIVDLSPEYASEQLWTSADYVNDSGVALGVSSQRVVEFKNGAIIPLPGINGGSTLADGGINASGDMAGTALDKVGQPHAVIWHSDGSMTVLDQGSKWIHTYGTGINDSDDVVGFGSATHGSTQDGFVYANGQLTPVPVPTGEQT